ncbi:MAG: phosphoribosylaminoimidazolesuccinocarboxamide synthase [Gammaproteobacteria bacterium]|nr:MAG: phosphoribosylaminoimidazolesuccinocarboxamide synthase [Gammaproteobacteria bacterium]
MKAVLETSINSLPLIHKGKVRDIYDIDDDHLLIITTDRVSAFDVILPTPIPEKGKVLTSVSNFWFEKTKKIIDNHLADISLQDILSADELPQTEGRSIIVKKLKPLPVEAIVRGYIIGSGWKDYQKTGAICGINLPEGLQLADRLPQPIFTPSTKAAVGDHDENISFEKTIDILGKDLAQKVKDISLKIYSEAAEYALTKGIIIADTKFEFGLDDDNKLYLIDEVLTPDSSRFWPADQHQPSVNPPSFDKQIIRDYLETLNWDKTAPGPELPQDISDKTAAKYAEVMQVLTTK